MKKILFTLICLFAMASGQYQMSIITADGERHLFPVSEIDELTFEGITGVEDGGRMAALLNSFTLLQNYPNPFNPSTTIEYSLIQPSAVRIEIFNIMGQLVMQVEREHQAAGEYSVRWDGRDHSGRMLASGVYIYQLTSRGVTESKRLLLLR